MRRHSGRGPRLRLALGMVLALGPTGTVAAQAPLPVPPAWPQDGTTGEAGFTVVPPIETQPRPGPSGSPLPRFASLRSAEVNLRAGPGPQFPVNWTYRRRALPVQIVAEFEHWRRVRDFEGVVGWAHRATLSTRRTLIVTGEERVLREAPREDADPLARLEPGVIAEVRSCEAGKPWCRVSVAGRTGWLRRSDSWGVLEDEGVE